MSRPQAFDDAGARAFLRGCFDAALAVVRPELVVAGHLPEKPKGRCVVVGAGKASAAMAAAVEAAWPDVAISGVVSTRYGHGVPTSRVRVIEAGHPVPDANSVRAAEAMLAAVAGLGPDDLVLALVSGGGSACLALPAEGLTLADKQAMTRALLHCGAPIGEINLVRRHASRIKNGALARAAGAARVVTLLISDVPGDGLSAIASGPTLADGSTAAEALAVLDRHGIAVPGAFRAGLARRAVAGAVAGGPVEARLMASPGQALAAAAAFARTRGVEPVLLGDALEGESRVLAAEMAGLARAGAGGPRVLLSGGETTVTIGPEGCGRGGRNVEFCLAFALACEGAAGIWALAADTDGIDGTDDAAGAIVGPGTLAAVRAAGLDAGAVLARHDCHALFEVTGERLVCGPTHTNVNDFRAVLVSR